MPIDLYFPPLNGGLEKGLNNAGIETFEGEIQRHIVRECTQNALDAKASVSGSVHVEIQLREIAADQIPALPALQKAIRAAQEYWKGVSKTEAFCQKALAWTNGSTISVLEISDYGTTGLEGTDGDRGKSWFGLVQSSGVTIKPDDAAGAFGIGKDAPFAGSFIRTVFYSSLNSSGHYAFQGVAKLTTHISDTNQKTQDVGFIGDISAGGECKAIRTAELIPSTFRRTKIGTSIFIVAYRHLGADDWTDGFVREAVENFWPAIHQGSLSFAIGSRRVDAATLPSLMSRYSASGDFPSCYHYRAVLAKNGGLERHKELPHLGSCRLYLIAGDMTYPKTICMTRQTGMVIYEASHFRSYRRFAGLFVCESTEGNTYLRKLEPPRHDKWDPSRIDSDPGEAKGVLQNVRDWINECLRELNPDDNAQETDVPELSRYLPDEEDEPLANETASTANQSGKEGILHRPVTSQLPVQVVTPRPPISPKGANLDSPEDGQEPGDGTGGGQVKPSPTPTSSPGGRSETTGGGSTGANSPHSPKLLLKTRSVRSGPQTYDLILRTTSSCAGKLVIASVGEDNQEDKNVRILQIETLGEGPSINSENFSLEANQSIRLRITLDSQVLLSLRAYCHGN